MHPDGWSLGHVNIQICGPRKPRYLEIEKFREPEKKEARPAPNRSRCGLRPISTRKWTDLEAEYDRSRRQGRQDHQVPSSPVKARQGPSGPGRCNGLANWLVQLQQATTQSLSNRCRARVDAELGVGAQQVRLDGRLSDV